MADGLVFLTFAHLSQAARRLAFPLLLSRTTPLTRLVPIGVKVRDKESIDRALKRFKRTVSRSRKLRDYRQKMSYTKPSEQRRLDAKRSVRRRHRQRKRSRESRR
jgi:small subunit ribosomal protein S21